MKRFRKDVALSTSGNHVGVFMLPSISLYIVTPISTTINSAARTNDIAEVNLNESETA